MSAADELADGGAGESGAKAVDRLIERFGGIRPMAAKMGVPVTTVQGWKKRGAIPVSRHGDILGAAEKNGISLDGIDLSAAEQAIADEAPARTGQPLALGNLGGVVAAVTGSLVLVVLVLMFCGLFIVKQKTADLSHRVNLLEETATAEQVLDKRVAALEHDPRAAGSETVPATTIVDLQQRVSELGNQVSRMSTLSQKVDDLQSASGNRDAMAQTISGLQQTVATLQGNVQSLSQSLEGERTHVADLDTAVNKKHAENARQFAIVLALNQLRTAASTSQPFDTELTAARGLAHDDPDVLKQLDVLANYSTDGAATLNELRAEFADKASEIVRSNVVGDGKSWQRQALYRLSSVISIRKIGSTSKQGVNTAEILVARAESKLEEDDLAGAVDALTGLSGLPKDISASWIDSAQRRLAVDGSLTALSELAIQRLGSFDNASAKHSEP